MKSILNLILVELRASIVYCFPDPSHFSSKYKQMLSQTSTLKESTNTEGQYRSTKLLLSVQTRIK